MEHTSFDLETNEPIVTPLAAAGPEAVAAEESALFDKLPAWEQVDIGRFRPRRIRGSYLGRELG